MSADMEKELVAAAGKGNGTRISLLLGSHTDVNCRSGLRKFTPLCKAAEQGHGSVIEQLLAAGADPLLTDSRGRTARDIALSKEYLDLAAMLEEAMGLAEPSLAAAADGSYDLGDAADVAAAAAAAAATAAATAAAATRTAGASGAGAAGAGGRGKGSGGGGGGAPALDVRLQDCRLQDIGAGGDFGFGANSAALDFERPAAVGAGIPAAAAAATYPVGGRLATPESVGGATAFGRQGFDSAAFASLMEESTAAAQQAARVAAAAEAAEGVAATAVAAATAAAAAAAAPGTVEGGEQPPPAPAVAAVGQHAATGPARESGERALLLDAERRSVAAEKRACGAEERAARAEERAARAEERAARAEERLMHYLDTRFGDGNGNSKVQGDL